METHLENKKAKYLVSHLVTATVQSMVAWKESSLVPLMDSKMEHSMVSQMVSMKDDMIHSLNWCLAVQSKVKN